MKVSLNWLKDYVDLNGIEVKQIIDKLTMAGLEVEDYIDQTEIYKDFITALVKDKQKHPGADKLSVCMVYDGKDEHQVICGAPNVESGQKVIFAKIGAVVPKSKIKIAKVKIRGVESSGMICSGDELELNDDQSGILVLDDSTEIGIPVTKVLGLNDVILEIGITPNRPDALSHIGVARDLAVLFNRELKLPKVNKKNMSGDVSEHIIIEIKDAANCPRYCGKVIKNAEVKESPDWLKQKLENAGLRPINNIVDATNYVMLECGQPLHAFDLDLLSDKKIIVDSTKKEGEFTTLDSKVRKIPEGTLLINDGKRPVAIAGVMGGENSEISTSTKNILIESAYFNPSSIRRTSKFISLSTDSSYRFERVTDPNNADTAAQRAAEIIAEIGGGEIIKGIADVYPERIKEREVQFRYDRCRKLLGYDVDHNEIKRIVAALGMKILREENEKLFLSIPAFRPDIEREADIIEEIARINGYENIPAVPRISITLEKRYDHSDFADRLRTTANAFGFFEMINNPLQTEKSASLTGNPIKVLNPQSVDMAFLRTGLLAGALEAVSNNIKVGERDLQLFEIGNVFKRISDKDINNFGDFNEESSAIFIITGKSRKKSWNTDEQFHNYHSLKGYIDSIILKFSLDSVLKDSYNVSGNSIYAYGLIKKFNDREIGAGGKIKNEVLKKFDIEQDVFCFEFYLDKLRNIKTPQKRYEEPLRFPKVLRDCAFTFDKSIPFGDVDSFIKEQANNLLKSVSLFDIFESESLGEDKRSMAFSLEYYSNERTLTEEEVQKEFDKLIKKVSEKFNAKLRG